MANVHLDATEYQDHVVFLHNIQEGPANRSYGLQVAKLAGIPPEVLDRARDKLAELEGGTPPTPAPASPSQDDLFGAQPHPVVDQLQDLDVDNLTPRQALEMLYELRRKLS